MGVGTAARRDRAGRAIELMEQSRLRWQCRRGMRELDVLLTRYLDTVYADSSDTDKAAFRRLLSLPDPELNAYILSGDLPTDEEMANVVSRILGRNPA